MRNTDIYTNKYDHPICIFEKMYTSGKINTKYLCTFFNALRRTLNLKFPAISFDLKNIAVECGG